MSTQFNWFAEQAKKIGEIYIAAAAAAQKRPDKVDPGIGRARLGQRIIECVLSIGTRSAQSIMASGHTGRTNRLTRQGYEEGSARGTRKRYRRI